MRYLGLDVGRKTIGLAVGEMIASELTTLRAVNRESFYQEPARTRAYEQIDKIASDEGVHDVIIGLPVDGEGNQTEESEQIEAFGRGLASATGRPVRYIDETLTSMMAKEMLESQEVDKKEADSRMDQLSAQLILQQYLEETTLKT